MVQIEEMVIRLPGMQGDDAGWIGEEVANRIAGNLPENEDRQIDELNIKLTVSVGSDRSDIADSIVKQLLQQLRVI